MKIKGRFIAVLAALGLLAALLPAIPTGAVAGVLTIDTSKGYQGEYFSDKDNYNILGVSVVDEDLDPPTTTAARYTDFNAPQDILLSAGVVAGDKSMRQEFHGADANPLCDPDGPDNDAITPLRAADTGTLTGNGVIEDDEADSVYDDDYDEDNDGATPNTKSCATVGEGRGDALYASVANTDTWTFTLEEVARDRNDDGVVNQMDVTVEVNGSRITTEITVHGRTDYSGDTRGDTGMGITQVRVEEDPDDRPDSVVIIYDVTGYNFSATTPLRAGRATVLFGTDADSATDSITVSRALSTGTIRTTDPLGQQGHIVVTFSYDKKDTEKKFVTVSSNTSLALGESRTPDGVEELPQNSKFEAELALFKSSDFALIKTQASNGLNDNKGEITPAVVDDEDTIDVDETALAVVDTNPGEPDEIIEIRELDNTDVLGKDLQDRVNDIASALGLMPADDAAKKLIPLLLPVTHGDTITVTYVDADPGTTEIKTASVDLEAPEVTLISPAHNLFTKEALLTLTADVVDEGAGVEQSGVVMVASAASINSGSAQKAPITNGYKITNVSRSAIPEGAHTWFVTVKDRVGNVPVLGKDAPRGAAPPSTPTGTDGLNSFKFGVDTSGPTVLSAKTGLSLTNVGVSGSDDPKDDERELEGSREWVKVTFDLGTGTAPLDPDSVQPNDFQIAGGTPLEGVVNKGGSAVYLQVGELLTDARPSVVLTGEVNDKAANARTSGTITSAIDGLAPALTVTPAAEIGTTEMVVTVESSERLGLNPTLQITTTKPVNGEALAAPKTEPLQLQLGSLRTYSTTIKNPANQAYKYYVVVTATDQNGNGDTVGDATSPLGKADTGDLISYQVDSKVPGLTFLDAEDRDLKKTKQDEGAVWIVAQFDDDEHADDKFKSVTVTSISLKDSGGTVIASDVESIFGGVPSGSTNNCMPATTDGDDYQDQCDKRTLAIDLAPGTYNIAITGVDAAGNSKSGNTDFEVGARKPFGLDLKPGVNLISVPGSPVGDSGNLNILFEDQPVNLITTYDRETDLAGGNPWLRSTRDPETGLFTGDIVSLQPGVAYFVTSDARVTVNVTLQRVVGELPPTMMVRFGYNTVGYWSIAPKPTKQPIDDYLNSIPWTVAYAYDPTPGRGWEVIRPGSKQAAADHTGDAADAPKVIMAEPGKGYLVFSRFDATLTP